MPQATSLPAVSRPLGEGRTQRRVRMLRDLGDIADAVVADSVVPTWTSRSASRSEATSKTGFTDDIRRTVSENASTLKFDTHGFEIGVTSGHARAVISLD